MATDGDDAQARKERADAIRRLRDLRNASITSGETAEDDAPGPTSDTAPDDTPNYVDLIDRKMRHDGP